MGIVKPSKPVIEQWGWDPVRLEWTEDPDVWCVNYQYREKDKSMCYASIEPGKQHGWTTAASDYYYCITAGSGMLEIEGDAAGPVPIREGNSFCIEKGTRYNYWADEGETLRFVLFMSKLWEEED